MQTIKISTANDIEKIKAFILAKAKGAFLVEPEILYHFLKTTYHFAKENNVKLIFKQPNDLTISILSTSGMMTGCGAGYMLAGVLGAIIGAGIGTIIGYSLAHLSISADFIKYENKFLITMN